MEIEIKCSKFVKQFKVENKAIDLSAKAVATMSSVCDRETMPPDLRKSPWFKGSGTWHSI